MIAKNGKLLSCCITGMGLRIELGAHKTKGEEYTKKKKEKTNLWNGGWLWF